MRRKIKQAKVNASKYVVSLNEVFYGIDMTPSPRVVPQIHQIPQQINTYQNPYKSSDGTISLPQIEERMRIAAAYLGQPLPYTQPIDADDLPKIVVELPEEKSKFDAEYEQMKPHMVKFFREYAGSKFLDSIIEDVVKRKFMKT